MRTQRFLLHSSSCYAVLEAKIFLKYFYFTEPKAESDQQTIDITHFHLLIISCLQITVNNESRNENFKTVPLLNHDPMCLHL